MALRDAARERGQMLQDFDKEFNLELVRRKGDVQGAGLLGERQGHQGQPAGVLWQPDAIGPRHGDRHRDEQRGRALLARSARLPA